MTSQEKKRAVRAKIFERQEGLCASCGEPMVLPETVPQTRHPRNDAACLYHLYSRYHSKRDVPHEGPSYMVVCVSCANSMSNAETAVQPLASLHVLSGRSP